MFACFVWEEAESWVKRKFWSYQIFWWQLWYISMKISILLSVGSTTRGFVLCIIFILYFYATIINVYMFRIRMRKATSNFIWYMSQSKRNNFLWLNYLYFVSQSKFFSRIYMLYTCVVWNQVDDPGYRRFRKWIEQ